MSIFRKTKAAAPVTDEVSGTAWSAISEGAYSAQIRLGCEDLSAEGREAIEDMARALHLTPASREVRLRTPVPSAWSFTDYESVVTATKVTCGAVIASGVEHGEALVQRMNDALEGYTKRVKRERAMERLSGDHSERRGAIK